MKETQSEILIIGCGFAGLTTAIQLQSNGIQCRIYESSSAPSKVGGGVCFFSNGMNVLKSAGVADKIIASGHVLKTIQFKDEREKVLTNKSVDGESLYGAPTVLVKRASALQHLIDRAQEVGVPIEFSKTLTEIKQHPDFITAIFEDGTQANGSLLIGADGLNSRVRTHVLEREYSPEYSQLIYVGGFVNDQDLIERLKLETGYQYVSLDPAGITSYSFIEEKNTLYWGTFFKQATRLNSKELFNLKDQDLIEKVLLTHAKSGKQTREIITRSNTVVRTNVSDINELPKWSRGRCIIIGDAAHAMNPMLGLGACVSLEDSHLLSSMLIKHKEHFEFVFDSFEKLRKSRTSKIVVAARRSARIGTVNFGPLKWLRDLLIYLLGKVVSEQRSNKFYSYRIEDDLKRLKSI